MLLAVNAESKSLWLKLSPGINTPFALSNINACPFVGLFVLISISIKLSIDLVDILASKNGLKSLEFNLVAILFVTVEAKFESSFKAAANSSKVSNAAGDPFIKLLICVSVYAFAAVVIGVWKSEYCNLYSWKVELSAQNIQSFELIFEFVV